jgi:hypothetical protein
MRPTPDHTQGEVVATTVLHGNNKRNLYRADDFENSPERRADYR